ncbi:hypothetical protein BJX76DRAFT_329638 [Aspergillus varians]
MSDGEESNASDWQAARRYLDHLGHPVVLEQYVETDNPPDPDHIIPIQVYSLVPLDPDHEPLRDYLLQTFADEEVLPLFEIYSYLPPDAFACLEHNRREIAYRKQQHRSGASDPPPLIPLFYGHYHRTPAGRCILLRSHSYRLGHLNDGNEFAAAGEGPALVFFNRSFSKTRSEVDHLQRLPSEDLDPDDEVYPEAFELSIERVRDQTDMGKIIMTDIVSNANGFVGGSLKYALDVDEGAPPDSTPAPPEQQIRDQLDQQFTAGGLTLDPAFRVSQDASEVVTVTNTPDGAEPDLQYPVYASFLSHLRGSSAASSLLESAARLLTAALVSHLPASKTLTLQFHIPESNNWSAILPAHRAAVGQQTTDLPIGALHTFPRGIDQPPVTRRVSPQLRSDALNTAQRQLDEPYRVFAVVLERVNFVAEAGVYFYMDDPDTSERPPAITGPDTEVWRSAGIREVARRLAMLAVEEEQQD